MPPTSCFPDWRALAPLLDGMSINAVLLDLQERLNLLNIQLVAARYGRLAEVYGRSPVTPPSFIGGSQIGELGTKIGELQSRVNTCRSSMQAHLQRLEETKVSWHLQGTSVIPITCFT